MRRLIVGISGASGVIYGIRLLEVLESISSVETHLVMSPYAKLIIEIETPYSPARQAGFGCKGVPLFNLPANTVRLRLASGGRRRRLLLRFKSNLQCKRTQVACKGDLKPYRL